MTDKRQTGQDETEVPPSDELRAMLEKVFEGLTTMESEIAKVVALVHADQVTATLDRLNEEVERLEVEVGPIPVGSREEWEEFVNQPAQLNLTRRQAALAVLSTSAIAGLADVTGRFDGVFKGQDRPSDWKELMVLFNQVESGDPEELVPRLRSAVSGGPPEAETAVLGAIHAFVKYLMSLYARNQCEPVVLPVIPSPLVAVLPVALTYLLARMYPEGYPVREDGGQGSPG